MLRKILITALLVTSTSAWADVSGNLGWQSQYIYRGIPQSNSSAQGGLDFENQGFYLGTWAADVGQGAEIDGYGGYDWSRGDYSFGVGATGYFYTDKFDDTYKEINLSLGYKLVTLDYANGRYDNFSGPTQDYSFGSATIELENGLYAVIGTFGDDFEGNYYSAGYGFEVEGLDLTVEWVYSDNKLLGDKESNIVFSIGKGFDLNK